MAVHMKAFLRTHWPVLLILLLGLAIRMLVTRDLWVDEFASFTQASKSSIPEVLDSVPYMHRPLYHLSLHLWMQMFGTGEMALRSLSIIVGVASIGVIYAIAYRFFSKPNAIVASLVLAVLPHHVWYSQEARMYAMVFLAAAISIYFFMALLEKQTKGRLIAWAIASFFLVNSHFTGILLFGLQILFAMYMWWRARVDSAEKSVSPWIKYVVIGILVLIVPAVYGLATSFNFNGGPPSFALHNFATAMGSIGTLLLGFHAESVVPRLGAAWPVLIYLVSMLFLDHSKVFDTAGKRFLLWLALSGLTAIAVAAFIYPPLFSGVRYLTFILPPVVLLVSLSLVRREGTVRMVGTAALLLILSVATYDSLFGVQNTIRTDHRASIEYVISDYEDGDMVLFSPPYLHVVFDYYYPKGYSEPIPTVSIGEFEGDEPYDTRRFVANVAKGRQRVFFVYGFEDIDPRVPPGIDAAQDVLGIGFSLGHTARFNNVTVECYTRTRPCPSGGLDLPAKKVIAREERTGVGS